MFRQLCLNVEAVVRDRLTTDATCLQELVDAVQVLFTSHPELALNHERSGAQEGRLQCVLACHSVAVYPSRGNRAALRRSWAALGAPDRQLLRHAARLHGTARNTALLELTGMTVPQERPTIVVRDDVPRDRPTVLGSNVPHGPAFRKRMSL